METEQTGRFVVTQIPPWRPEVPPWFAVTDAQTGAVIGYGYGADPEKACRDEATRLNTLGVKP
jgi:hypothetical protein